MSYLCLYLRYWKKFFSFQLPLNSSFKSNTKIGRFKSLKFTYEWRQQMWRHNLTFGVILWAILIGVTFCIFRPSLVGKELKQAKLFSINRNCHVLISPLGGCLAPPCCVISAWCWQAELRCVAAWLSCGTKIFCASHKNVSSVFSLADCTSQNQF